MKDFCLTQSSIGQFIQLVYELMKEPKKYRVNIVLWREKRSISQNSLQHVIYSDISKYLISKGRIEWTEKKVKESLKSKFLGWEQREIIDVVTGEITVKEMLRESSKLDVGEAFHYTTQIIEWAESIGCGIKIPAKCEYREIMERQSQ